MNKKASALLPLLLLAALAVPLSAGHRLLISLSLYSGSTNPQGGDSQVVVSYNLATIFQGPLEIEPTADAASTDIAQLKKALNIPRIDLVSHNNLLWDSAAGRDLETFVLMGGNEYRIALAPVSLNGSYKFRVEVAVKDNAAGKGKLVDSEIVLTEKRLVVLGFRGDPSTDMRHFIALRIAKATETAGDEAVARVSEKDRPKLLNKVAPVYPKEAMAKRLQGVVVVEATTDEKGNVVSTRVLGRGTDPLLNDAASTAVKQWQFAPYLKNGKPTPVIFTVTITFRLKNEGKPEHIASPAKPELLTKVAPLYPEAARRAGIAGKVTLEATIDENGNVSDARVLESGNADLSKAASDAVRQWKYRPYLLNGIAKPACFTVTVTFQLDKEKK